MTINRISDESAPVLRRPILHLSDGSARSHGLAADLPEGPIPDRLRPARAAVPALRTALLVTRASLASAGKAETMVGAGRP